MWVWLLLQTEVRNYDTVLASKPVLSLARNDGVISLDNIHNDVSVIVCRVITALVGFPNECFVMKSLWLPEDGMWDCTI